MMNMQIFQALLDGVLMGGVYALAALGLSLIFGVMKITNFAHGAMMTVGMYTVYVVSTGLGISPYIALIFAVLKLLACVDDDIKKQANAKLREWFE